jgi:steroid 5-alpha reductase family enzyme
MPASIVRGGLYFNLFFIALNMYYCLTEWTGAIPAEYYSRQKRKGYDAYMNTTNMLIPWWPKEDIKED